MENQNPQQEQTAKPKEIESLVQQPSPESKSKKKIWKIAGSILAIFVLFAGYKLQRSPKEITPAKDGFINKYNSLPTAFEKKQQLFETGAIEEVASSFGIRAGTFSKTNQTGDGWSFIKNKSPILWDGTKDGTIDLYQDWETLQKSDGSKEVLSPGMKYLLQERASLLSCYLGFPVSIVTKSYKEVGNSYLMGSYADAGAVWFVISIPNDVIEKADIEELIKTVTFATHALLVLKNPSDVASFDGTEQTLAYIKDRIAREEDPKAEDNMFQVKIKDSKVLGGQYLLLKSFAANPNLLTECMEEKMKDIKNPYKK